MTGRTGNKMPQERGSRSWTERLTVLLTVALFIAPTTAKAERESWCMGGRSIAPLATAQGETDSFVTLHNVGPAAMELRVVFYYPNGAFAGRTDPLSLAAHATYVVRLGEVAGHSGIEWVHGPVYIQWVALDYTEMSSFLTVLHTEDDAEFYTLPLDDLGPYSVTRQEFEDIAGTPDLD
jgi:hypothetical protein